ncbi:cytokinin riboside 5'-monophosphate phosphoribohydrolase, partial [Lecanoromycetidae sp. Uapishka_2]
MHSRKHLMAKEVIEGGPGSGFVALSGGYGTLEELMEITTWNQLGIHERGVVVYNVEGYYDGLINWVRTAVSAGFIAPGNAGILVEALDAKEVVRQLKDYKVAEGRFNLDWHQK